MACGQSWCCRREAFGARPDHRVIARGDESGPNFRDPAELSGSLRFFHRNWRPTRLGKMWNRAFAWVAGHGLLPPMLITLQVENRRSGRLGTIILVVAWYEGQRYLVSMLADRSAWVRNLRAAGGGRQSPHQARPLGAGHAHRDPAGGAGADPEGLVPGRDERPPPLAGPQ
jgi:hypothetical protein